MDFTAHLASRQLLLTEGSIYERLRRDPALQTDSAIYHAALIYDEHGRRALANVHREYLDVGQSLGVPMLAYTDTWRANHDRIASSAFANRPVNQDDARFLRSLRDSYGVGASPSYIAGSIGPRGDAYKPEEALTAGEAVAFHTPQIEALVEGGVDCLIALTIPALSEALGIARAMAATDLPYLISFVLRPDGVIMDGTRLSDAMRRIDHEVAPPPAGYSVNCVYPTAFARGICSLGDEAPDLIGRMVSFQANSSARDPAELDGLDHLDSGDPEELARLIGDIYTSYGIPVLGGCCGTDTRHIAMLGKRIVRKG